MEMRGKEARKDNVIASAQRSKLEHQLIENFILLQRALTNVSVKLDDVSDKISKLLEIFEISAKALAEKNVDFVSQNKDIMKKLEDIEDQNRVIAKGLTILNEKQSLPATTRPPFPTREFLE